ncbi:carbohydrate ABC transporter permease [Vallitalea longa]|uniref:carbohydrate ABC transporter permease n=1 Tax=Vallitalea longa TaxID=2936439 RepID=UPI002491EDF4|nr:sugar ABC transporter permease [Vallitalea longa]
MYKKRNIWITLFLLPTIIIFVLIFAVPVVNVVYTSFFQWRGFKGAMSFVGIKNYVNAFKDASFRSGLTHTMFWVVLQGTVHVALGTIVALLLADRPKGWKFIRTSYMVPNMISGSAFAIILVNIFNPQIGLVNSVIRKLGFENFNHNWYFDGRTAFPTVTITWLLFAGLITILILAEIMSIPKTIYESADIEGATKFQQKIYITLPLLRNVIGTCVIIAATSMLKEFELVYLTTKGGPGDRTLSLPLYLYKTAFIENDYGYANMMGTVLIICGIICILIINKLFGLGKSDT